MASAVIAAASAQRRRSLAGSVSSHPRRPAATPSENRIRYCGDIASCRLNCSLPIGKARWPANEPTAIATATPATWRPSSAARDGARGGGRNVRSSA